MEADQPLRDVRAARNQALFRQVNERVEAIAHGFEPKEPINFVCECSNPECTRHVELTLAEYEDVRADSTHFAIYPGHDSPDDVDIVVSRSERFWVVEKVGQGATVARATDARQARGDG